MYAAFPGRHRKRRQEKPKFRVDTRARLIILRVSFIGRRKFARFTKASAHAPWDCWSMQRSARNQWKSIRRNADPQGFDGKASVAILDKHRELYGCSNIAHRFLLLQPTITRAAYKQTNAIRLNTTLFIRALWFNYLWLSISAYVDGGAFQDAIQSFLYSLIN